ncbi:hypothetical protein EVAR_73037_1 [Eumeta japonica]|uniref:Uncharacterized protein n=1 Tax=Eumeta variegata TaxID=151549 RepID=A0A4C1SYG5_EUMVA|nr:hypothetical protein EVAR_73037_1 [Eumeta japonica]
MSEPSQAAINSTMPQPEEVIDLLPETTCELSYSRKKSLVVAQHQLALQPEQSAKAVVPLSSSLPSKLLRFHAKKSAQALLQRMCSQEQSVDSQFDSDEGLTMFTVAIAATMGMIIYRRIAVIRWIPCRNQQPTMSPPPPRNSPSTENTDEN